jgi:hypothetical protein
MKFTASRVAVLVAAVAASVLGSIPAASAAPIDDSAASTQVSRQITTAQPITIDDLKAILNGTHADGVRVVPGKGAATPAKILGWDVPNARQFYLTESCNQWAGDIRTGAAAWNQLSEGGGTPVSCQTTYITDCGATGAIIGCNYNAGERITLDPAGTGQVALLAAHEFGHDWYGHSADGCANWNSPEDVMRPTICG